MRDRTILRADIWRPEGDGRYPVIVQRTPYDKALSFFAVHLYGLEPLRAVREGFVVVYQDSRGRFQSDGEFAPFVNESDDGADTIAWAAAQPFCDGNVLTYGSSYVGATQLLAATTQPHALRAMVPNVTASEYYDGWFYAGGALQLGFALYWACGLGGATLARRVATGEDVGELLEQLNEALADPEFQSHLPIADRPLLREICPAYFDWLAHPARDDWWRATAINQRYDRIAVPALHIGGWSDIFLEGTIRNYVGLRAGAATPEARAGQRLLIGPWAHGNPHEHSGDLDCGPAASQLAVDMTQAHLEFYRDVLAGRVDERPPVRIFTMGANVWRDEDDWPLPRAQDCELHLHEGGELREEQPREGAEPTRYVYDPADPVSTVGGGTLLGGALVGRLSGPRDQRAVEGRADVLLFTTGPLPHDLEVTGAVRLVLYASSSAVDTDFTAKLVDVDRGGRAIGIADGIVRARRREGLDREVYLQPGKPTRFEIAVGSTSMLFRAGHRLRLQISSSNFPRFQAHPNVAGDLAAVGPREMVLARQAVFHDASRPSRLLLPVVGR